MSTLADITARDLISTKAGDYLQLARALALSRNSVSDAEAELERRLGPRHPLAQLVMKAATNPLTTTGTPADLSPYGTAFLGLVGRLGAFDGLPWLKVPANTPVGIDDVTGVVVAWVDESGLIPVGELTTDLERITVEKLAGILALSREVARDPRTQAYHDRSLTRAAAIIADTGMFDPSESGSLANGATEITATASVLADMASLLAAISDGAATRPALVLGASAARTLVFSGHEIFADIRFNGPGTVAGIPTVVSPAPALAEFAVAIDVDGVIISDEGVSIDSAGEATLVLDNAPSGGPGVSLWQKNLVGYRIIRYLGFVKREDAVAWLSLAGGSP
jgi:hypothetical protein